MIKKVGVNGGLDAPMSESWFNNSSQHQHNNSTTTFATSVAGGGAGLGFGGGGRVPSPMPSLSGSSTGATTVDSAPPTPSTLYSSSTNDFDDFTGMFMSKFYSYLLPVQNYKTMTDKLKSPSVLHKISPSVDYN